MRALRFPIAPPALLRCLRSAVPWWRPSIRSRGWPDALRSRAWTLYWPVAPPASFPRRRWDLPGSWMDPCARAPLSDPGGISAPGHFRRLDAAARKVTAPAPSSIPFEAQSRGSLTRCLRFEERSCHVPRKTRFRLVASLCRAGFSPAGSTSEGFRSRYIAFPLPQAYPGAIPFVLVPERVRARLSEPRGGREDGLDRETWHHSIRRTNHGGTSPYR